MSRTIALTIALATAVAAAEAPVSLSIERASGDKWEPVEASTVFQGGDEIRFVFRSSEPGYLYILNETAKGERNWIFPPPGDPAGNRIERDRDYRIPAEDAAFRVANEPGYESLYYVLTSVRLPGLPSAVPPVERRSARNTLLPRCHEGTLRARGVCMDSSAGAHPLQDPGRIDSIRQLLRTDATESGKLFIYELRLAHR